MAKKKVVIVAEAGIVADLYQELLVRRFGENISLHVTANPEEAVGWVRNLPRVDLLWTNRFFYHSSTSGLTLARLFKDRFPQGKVIGTSASDDRRVFEDVPLDAFILRQPDLIETENQVAQLLRLT